MVSYKYIYNTHQCVLACERMFPAIKRSRWRAPEITPQLWPQLWGSNVLLGVDIGQVTSGLATISLFVGSLMVMSSGSLIRAEVEGWRGNPVQVSGCQVPALRLASAKISVPLFKASIKLNNY